MFRKKRMIGTVAPAKAGTHREVRVATRLCAPAFAGVTRAIAYWNLVLAEGAE